MVEQVKLKYLKIDYDRHGNLRCYFRRKGHNLIRLRGAVGSEEFMLAYYQALAGVRRSQRIVGQPREGSFGKLCLAYFASPVFKALDQSTKSWRRRALEAICVTHADKPAALMEPRHVRRLRDALHDKPGAARNRLKALRAFFQWAIEEELTKNNPTLGVQPIKYRSTPHHTWTEEEVEAFKKRHGIGTTARLAFSLLLYTSWRREDAVRLGPQHIHVVNLPDGSAQKRIVYRQAKNENRNPIDMDIPLHPELERVIETVGSKHMTFLVTAFGRPFTVNGFGNRFKNWCRQADLPHCTAHGLRRTAAVRLAQNLATSHEIMAVTGHRSLKEAEHYTQGANRRTLADSAMKKFK
jgi:integrase/recombinase XerD